MSARVVNRWARVFFLFFTAAVIFAAWNHLVLMVIPTALALLLSGSYWASVRFVMGHAEGLRTARFRPAGVRQ